MAVFSQWQPGGGYRYYEARGYFVPIGDDLPNPVLPRATKLGVPSIECGRPIPGAARPSGDGMAPQGTIVPMSTSRLGQLLPTAATPLVWAALGAGAVGLLWLVWGRAR